MENISKKYIIKIPNEITIIYSPEKKVVILVGVLAKRTLRLDIQLFLIKSKNKDRNIHDERDI